MADVERLLDTCDELERDRNEWREANAAALQVIQREAEKNALLAARVEWARQEVTLRHPGSSIPTTVPLKQLSEALFATDDEVRKWKEARK